MRTVQRDIKTARTIIPVVFLASHRSKKVNYRQDAQIVQGRGIHGEKTSNIIQFVKSRKPRKADDEVRTSEKIDANSRSGTLMPMSLKGRQSLHHWTFKEWTAPPPFLVKMMRSPMITPPALRGTAILESGALAYRRRKSGEVLVLLLRVVCVKFSKLVMVRVRWFIQVTRAASLCSIGNDHPFVPTCRRAERRAQRQSRMPPRLRRHRRSRRAASLTERARC
jgi:hypothetical protein